MYYSKPQSTVGKGQMRCFQCRQAYLMKDGNWVDHKNQQVFLCKSCEKSLLASRAAVPAMANLHA
jgi:hypothetical protein